MCAAIGSDRARVTLSAFRVDVLADDNGIVDDESENDDQAEQRNHRYRDAQCAKHQEAAHERRGDADADPDCQFEIQHQDQEQEDERKTEGSVSEQQVDAFAQQLGFIPKLDDLDAGRGRVGGQEPVDSLFDREYVLGLGAGHSHENGRAVIVEIAQPLADEAVANGRDIGQCDLGAVGECPDNHRLECLAGLPLLIRPEQDLARI